MSGRTSPQGRKAAAQLGATLDPRAKGPAAAWIVGFGLGNVNKMLRASALPFRVGKHYAKTFKHLGSIYRALVAETPTRTLQRGVSLLTAAGLRQRLGTLPRGITLGSGHLYVVARFMRNDLVLVLEKKGGGWYVVGLAR